ncbi:hypothetical protein [Tropicimonas sp. S265A]|uniref:hypothetical protein n=1 Tax=Tropicimonas sp. S265A TaxID=3415134 RepID=UPI003C7BB997
MSFFTSIALISGAIIALLLARAVWVVRSELRNPPERGAAPGPGETVIDVSYHSGGAGGGHSAEIRMSRDPQDQARFFIPLSARQPDKGSDND